MIAFSPGAKVWLAGGATDMRKGMNGLALLVQQGLGRDPHAGELFCFRGRRGSLMKVLWHDGVGMSLYVKRLDHGRFIWPTRSCPLEWCSWRGQREHRHGPGRSVRRGQADDGIISDGGDGLKGHVAGALDGHSSFCSRRIAPTRRVMAASLGKMPTTSVRRLISPLRRSSGLTECSLARWAAGKVM